MCHVFEQLLYLSHSAVVSFIFFAVLPFRYVCLHCYSKRVLCIGTKVHKEGKRIVGTDKQRYIDNLAEVAEQGAATGNMKQLYDTTRKLTGKYSRQEDQSRIRRDRSSWG